MKNLKITESCLVNGDHAEAGTILKNVDNAVAAELVCNGRAVEIPNNGEVIGNRDPQTVENRDPKAGGKKAKGEPVE